MTDEFLTMGLQNDRYLKALLLVDQFEDEIEAKLLEFDQRMVDAHPDLFDPSTDPSVRTNQSPSNGLAIHRINHSMIARDPESDHTQKLNVHLYWMPPMEYKRTDVEDGALRAFGYKIKNADQDTDNRVAEQTQAGDWSIETSGNPYDSNTVFYRHVRSAADIEETMDLLVSHFSKFGDEYASNRNEQS